MKHFSLTLLLMLAWALLPQQAAAQRNCGAMEHLEHLEEMYPDVRENMLQIERFTERFVATHQPNGRVVYTIPVVVHVVYNTATENISTAQIQSQIDVLNRDFRRLNTDADGTWSQAGDSEIEFCLATVDPAGNATTGITRTSTSVTSFGTNDNVKRNANGGKDPWNTSQYLNIWVCDISGSILGYAQFPGGPAATDGVVIDYAYFGTTGTATPPFNLGRTATHEVGHWLNLRHIWGDGGCSVDDFVSDTPLAGAPNYTGSPCTFPGPNTCNSGAGDQPDMFQNYMDYSDDVCMNLFTNGQIARMRALFASGGARASLLSSPGCGGTPPPPPPSCTQNTLTLSLTLDNYGSETTWTLTNSTGGVLYSGGPYSNNQNGTVVTAEFCVPNGCYNFNIFDSYGDGICCAYGNGSYSVTNGSTVLASGGSFTSSQTTNFCLGGPPPPTCTDGIQNGDETGIDCGGSTCSPCNTGCTYATINSNNFESGFGIWTDGGTDCARINSATYANSGTFSIRLRDNTSSSTMSTTSQNWTAYSEITVDFSFITVSFENGEDFWVQVSTNGGSTYTTIATGVAGTNFNNNTRYNASVVIPGPFTTNTRLRFRADASADDDQIYFDDVVIRGCQGGGNRETDLSVDVLQPEILSTLAQPRSLEVFPNPTSEWLQVQLNDLKGQVWLVLTDLSGRTLHRSQVDAAQGNTRIQCHDLPAGLYFLRAVDQDGIVRAATKVAVQH